MSQEKTNSPNHHGFPVARPLCLSVAVRVAIVMVGTCQAHVLEVCICVGPLYSVLTTKPLSKGGRPAVVSDAMIPSSNAVGDGFDSKMLLLVLVMAPRGFAVDL